MAFHAQAFCGMSGMQYDKQSGTCWGRIQGYHVFVSSIARKDSVIFRLGAKAPEQLTEEQVTEQITEWSRSHTGISALVFRERCFGCIISLTPRDTDQALAMRVAELVAFAAQVGLIPCCMSCGTETGFRAYLLDNGGVTLCDSCKPYLEQKMLEEMEAKAQQKPNWGGLILGALLGAAAVFILTYFVLKLSYLSVLTGFAGILLGLYMMRRLGRKITVPSAVVCTLLCLTAAMGAILLNFAGEMAENCKENEATAAEICESYEELQETISEMTAEERIMLEQATGEKLDLTQFEKNYHTALMLRDNTTTLSCIQNFPALISTDHFQAMQVEMLKCILYSLFSVIVGTAVTAPSMVREDKGKHTLRELPL